MAIVHCSVLFGARKLANCAGRTQRLAEAPKERRRAIL